METAYEILFRKPKKGRYCLRRSNGCDNNLKRISEKVWGVDWIYLAQDGLQQQALVDSIITLCAAEKTGCF
jgi:hypothetical protein